MPRWSIIAFRRAGAASGRHQANGPRCRRLCAPSAPYGVKTYSTCEAIDVLVQTYYQTKIPISYNSCTGSKSHGPYAGFYTNEPGGDIRPAERRRCMYSGPTTPPCFRWVADEWLTFEVRVKTGARVDGEFANSEYQLWAAREGKAPTLLIDWHPGVGGYAPLTARDPNTNDDQSFGKVWLLPYMTAKDQVRRIRSRRRGTTSSSFPRSRSRFPAALRSPCRASLLSSRRPS
jgi:hypothetical protein